MDENYETATSRSISCMPTFQVESTLLNSVDILTGTSSWKFFVNGHCTDDVIGADIEKVLEKVKKHARVAA